MAYASPAVTPSGASLSAFQAWGASGQLNQLIALNSAGTSPPTAAATVAATGGGTTGGLLAPGVYYLRFTETNGFGETTASPESASFTVTAGDIPQVTFPPLQTGNVARSVYLTPPGGAPGSELLYARDISAGTFNLTVAAPATNYASPPPTTNSTVWSARAVAYARAARANDLERVYEELRQLISDFNEGRPMIHAHAIAKLREIHGVFALLDHLCAEVGTLIDANPGHLASLPTGIGGVTPRRVWP